MMGAKMKDWDKEDSSSGEEQGADAGVVDVDSSDES